jgi:NAD(P)-dependent dehydrogenase (short-subunit alcohol dehydrogenase family)
VVDVTDENAVISAYAHAATEYGGLDILVSNAGISSAAPIDETELAIWDRNMDILGKGYFLVSREEVIGVSHGSEIVSHVWTAAARFMVDLPTRR